MVRMPAKLSVATDAWARNANETSLEVIEWMKQRNFSMPGDLDQNLNQRPFSAKWISNYNTGGPIAINSVKWVNLYDNYTFRYVYTYICMHIHTYLPKDNCTHIHY